MKEIESQQIYISILFLVQNSTLTQILDFSACAQHHFQIMNEHESLRPQSLFRFFFLSASNPFLYNSFEVDSCSLCKEL